MRESFHLRGLDPRIFRLTLLQSATGLIAYCFCYVLYHET
jgi:hypothetical protein